MKTTLAQRRSRGFTLLELMIVISVLGLLVALAVPNFLKTRTHARKQICIENLAQIESAKQLWGLENQKTDGDKAELADLVGTTSYMKHTPDCPAGGDYDTQVIGVVPTCSISGHVLPPND